MSHRKRCSIAYAILLTCVAGEAEAVAQKVDYGGSVRGYQFLRLQDLPEELRITRRDSEYLSGRLTLKTSFTPNLVFETHAALDFLSPPQTLASSVATGRAGTFLPLEHEFSNDSDYSLIGSLDRLNFEMNFKSFSVKLGRQAIGWGVNYFWPAMDLFGSFAPQRIDRDYKVGVDAIRVTVPLGQSSEVQLIGAVLGPSLREDGTAAAKTRFHLGRFDLGFMGGKFHRDTVAGTYFVADLGGTGYRGEVTWTDSGDTRDLQIGRAEFWRATLGLDRQLTSHLAATVEFFFNGFGSGDPSGYSLLLESDRIRRGECPALGRYYAGTSVSWQIRPLWTLNQTLLINAGDPSAYWIPAVDWSTSNNSSLLLAAEFGLGSGFGTDLSLKSEYGIVPATIFAAFRWYF